MKFIALIFRLVFLLLEVEGSSLLDVAMALPKQQEAAHSNAMGMTSSAAHKMAAPSMKSAVHKPKQSKELRKTIKGGETINKNNNWGLKDVSPKKTLEGASKATPVKSSAASHSPNRTKKVDVWWSKSKMAVHEKNGTLKAAPPSVTKTAAPGGVDHPKDSKKVKSPEATVVKQTVAKVATDSKSHPKDSKIVKPAETTAGKQTVSKAAAPASKSHPTDSKEKKSANVAAANKAVNHSAAVVKAAPTAPHVLVRSKGRSRGAAAMGAQNKAEYQLLNFLAAEIALKDKNALPPFDVYLPACLEHTHNLIDNLDMAYTDVQLHTVLVDECWLKKSFPQSHDSSFNTDAACKQFATQLMNARYLELQMGSQEGYEGFCADYYAHKCGDKCKKKAEAPEPPPKPPKGSFPWMFLIVAGVIIILFIVILCMVIKKRNENNA